MIETYYIDKNGGSHYHAETCQMIKDPNYHYEPITRTKRVELNNGLGDMPIIREDGKYYYPCSCVMPSRF